MEPINVIIEETRKKIEAELFKSFSDVPAGYELRAKPLSPEDLEEFKRQWIEEMNKPRKPQNFSLGATIKPEPIRLSPLTISEVDPLNVLRRHELTGISVLNPYNPQVAIKGV